MTIWSGFFDALKSFIKWRGARKAQSKRFRIFLAEDQEIRLQESINAVQTAFNTHMDTHHKKVKVPKEKPVEADPQIKVTLEEMIPDPSDRKGLELWINGE